jgi:CO/xanthine dehydrogenase Mo-binding subunit
MEIRRVEYSFIGKRIPKIDSVPLAKGETKFVIDLKLPSMLFGKILTSPYPHARILHIDTTKARRLPGVKAIITAEDMPDKKFGGYVQDERPLAKDKVRYIGDSVAAAAAIDEESAEEAIELIRVEYEEIPAVFDVFEAMEPGAPKIHGAERNIAATGKIEAGDIEEAFLRSDEIFEDTFVTSRVKHCCLQSFACLASVEAGTITVWPTTQNPLRLRTVFANYFGIPYHKVRVIQFPLGGGFGLRVDPFAADFCCIALAQKTRRPVKIVHTSEEEFQNTKTRLPQIIRLKTGVRRDGTIMARHADILCDNGAYTGSSPGNSNWGGLMFGALYRIPNFRHEWRLIYTNLQPSGSMRGYGNPQIHFAGESQMDMIAERLGMDPMDLRLENAVQIGDKTASGPILHSCGLVECIDKVAEMIDWRQKRFERRPFRGVGMACMIHCSGARLHPFVNADYSSARVRLNDDGTVNLSIGTGDMGTGSNTVMAQIAAEELGVRLEDVKVLSGDTEVGLPCSGGTASRLTTMCGNSVRKASQKVRRRLFKIAAEKLEASIEDLEARDRRIYVRGSPDMGVPISEVVRASVYRKGGQSIVAEAYFDGNNELPDPQTGCGNVSTSYPFACQAAEVEVDPETGVVKILRFVAAHDVGRVINALTAEGQVEGGVAMGIGYALSEELIYYNGRLVNGNFLDYKLPTALDVPKIDIQFIETIDPNGPFGAKGLAEPSLIPTAPAILNAIYDAIGVRFKELPVTQEKIQKALKEKRLCFVE